MKTKVSKKEKVLAILLRDGYISNLDCVRGIHGFISLRLSDIVFQLKNEKKIYLDEEKSGYREGTMDWVYYLKKPNRWEEYTVEGRVIKRIPIYIT